MNERPLNGNVEVVAFSPDGQTFAAGGRFEGGDPAIIVWNLETDERYNILAHLDVIKGLQFIDDGARLVSGSYDETIRLWDVQTGEQVATLNVGVDIESLAYNEADSSFAVGTREGEVLHWRWDEPEIDRDTLIAWTRANRLVLPLTCAERATYRIEPYCG